MELEAISLLRPPATRPSAGMWLRWIACAVAVGVLVRTLAASDLRLAASLIQNAGPRVCAIFVPCLVALALDTLACRILFSALGRLPSYARLFGARFAGEAVAMSLPAGGVVVESLNLLLFKERCGLAYGDSIAGMGAKKWLVMRAHAVYITLSVAVGFTFLAERSRAVVGAPGLPWIVLASALVPLALSLTLEASLARGSAAAKLIEILRRIPSERVRRRLASRKHAFTETDACFARIAGARAPCARALALFVATWLMESVETLVILRVLGAPIGPREVLSFEAGLSLLRSLAFFSPSGLGVQDLGYVAFLGSLGVPDAAALAAAFVLLKRAKEIVFVVAGYAQRPLALAFVGAGGGPICVGAGGPNAVGAASGEPLVEGARVGDGGGPHPPGGGGRP
jgi:glycosyltransferase 2 family protein